MCDKSGQMMCYPHSFKKACHREPFKVLKVRKCMTNKNKTALLFYRTASGVEPVRKWLKGLPDEGRKELGLDLMRVQ